MRVLFTTFAARSHLYAQIPLAWALRAAGHEVCVATHPDGVEHVRSAGLTAIPVGDPLNQKARLEELDERQDEAGRVNPEAPEALDYVELTDIGALEPGTHGYEDVQTKLLAITMSVFQTYSDDRFLDDLVGFVGWWGPDLVVWDSLAFAGGVAAVVGGAAHCRLLFGLDLVGWVWGWYRGLGGGRGGVVDDPLVEWLGWCLGRFGVGLDEGDVGGWGELVVGQWSVDPVPGSLALPVGAGLVGSGSGVGSGLGSGVGVGVGVGGVRVPVRWVPFSGGGVVSGSFGGWPGGGRWRVLVTLGVSHRELLGGDRVGVGVVLAGLAGLDGWFRGCGWGGVEVVATLSGGQVAGVVVPSNVGVVEFVPLDVVVPECDVVVSHGGAGAFQAALVWGVPQVVVPDLLWDTARKGVRLQEVGAGVVVDPRGLDADGVRCAVGSVLLDGSYRVAAGRLRDEVLGAPAPADVVPVLETLTYRHKPQ
ncbi:hypothetical protein OHR68_32905 [Spirillospora sp. NBC_00431]